MGFWRGLARRWGAAPGRHARPRGAPPPPPAPPAAPAAGLPVLPAADVPAPAADVPAPAAAGQVVLVFADGSSSALPAGHPLLDPLRERAGQLRGPAGG